MRAGRRRRHPVLRSYAARRLPRGASRAEPRWCWGSDEAHLVPVPMPAGGAQRTHAPAAGLQQPAACRCHDPSSWIAPRVAAAGGGRARRATCLICGRAQGVHAGRARGPRQRGGVHGRAGGGVGGRGPPGGAGRSSYASGWFDDEGALCARRAPSLHHLLHHECLTCGLRPPRSGRAAPSCR